MDSRPMSKWRQRDCAMSDHGNASQECWTRGYTHWELSQQQGYAFHPTQQVFCLWRSMMGIEATAVGDFFTFFSHFVKQDPSLCFTFIYCSILSHCLSFPSRQRTISLFLQYFCYAHSLIPRVYVLYQVARNKTVFSPLKFAFLSLLVFCSVHPLSLL